MREVYICNGKRTPIGRFGGSLAMVRPDDLLASVIKEIISMNMDIDIFKIDDVIIGCANQAGEDNRNIARMSSLLADLPVEVPGVTINRLCGSGLNAIGIAAAITIRSISGRDCQTFVGFMIYCFLKFIWQFERLSRHAKHN